MIKWIQSWIPFFFIFKFKTDWFDGENSDVANPKLESPMMVMRSLNQHQFDSENFSLETNFHLILFDWKQQNIKMVSNWNIEMSSNFYVTNTMRMTSSMWKLWCRWHRWCHVIFRFVFIQNWINKEGNSN